MLLSFFMALEVKIVLIAQKLDRILVYLEAIDKNLNTNENELWAWLSKDEVMEHLRISKSTYYSWQKREYLTPCSLIGEDRFLVQEINRFVAGHGRRQRIKSEPKKPNI